MLPCRTKKGNYRWMWQPCITEKVRIILTAFLFWSLLVCFWHLHIVFFFFIFPPIKQIFSVIFFEKFLPVKLRIIVSFEYLELVSCLMDGETRMTGNTSAIIEAAIRGHTEIVRLLLDFGVNPNCLNRERNTGALHEATRFLR